MHIPLINREEDMFGEPLDSDIGIEEPRRTPAEVALYGMSTLERMHMLEDKLIQAHAACDRLIDAWKAMGGLSHPSAWAFGANLSEIARYSFCQPSPGNPRYPKGRI